MLGLNYAIRATQVYTPSKLKGTIIASPDVSGNKFGDDDKDLSGNPVFAYTYIIYGVFVEGENPLWYWCDEFQQVESPPVLAEGYNGTTALRDGLAVVVSGTFYQ